MKLSHHVMNTMMSWGGRESVLRAVLWGRQQNDWHRRKENFSEYTTFSTRDDLVGSQNTMQRSGSTQQGFNKEQNNST